MRDATPDVQEGDGCLFDSQDSWRMRPSRRHRPLPFSSHAQADTTTNGQATDHPSGRDQRQRLTTQTGAVK